jgi:hypothetical protein
MGKGGWLSDFVFFSFGLLLCGFCGRGKARGSLVFCEVVTGKKMVKQGYGWAYGLAVLNPWFDCLN